MAIFSASRNSFKLKRDEPGSNKVQRSQADREPQQHSEQEGAPAHLSQGGAGDTTADEEQRRGEAESAKSEEPMRGMLERREIRIANGGQNKKRDEPGERDAGTAVATGRNSMGPAVLDGRREKCERNDPESAGEFYGGADNQGLGSVFRGGADDRAGVVDRQRGPQSELRLRKTERVSDRRKNQHGDRVQNKNRAERYRHFFFMGLKNRPDGGDGTAAANRRAGSNQK